MKRNLLKATLLTAILLMATSTSWGQTKKMSAEVEAKIAARTQITNLPTLYITISDVNLDNIDNELFKTRISGGNDIADYHNATITLVGGTGTMEDFTDDVQIKVRGNATSSLAKRPYRLKFAKQHKHDLLGRGYTKRNWVLFANAYDHSNIRNAITYHIAQYVGMPFCPGYQFVDLVFIDQNGKTDYRGLYQISDHVEVGSNRVDIDEDNDWMIEYTSREDQMDAPCFTASGDAPPFITNVKNPDTDGWLSTSVDSLLNEIKTWETNWYKGFLSWYSDAWEDNNDTESLVNFYIGTDITGDYDGFFAIKGHVTNSDKKFHWGPIWDKDLAFNNCNKIWGTGVQLAETFDNGQVKGIFNGLHSSATFVEKVYQKVNRLVGNGLYTNLCNDIDAIASSIEQSFPLNSYRWSDENGNETNWGLESQGIGSSHMTLSDHKTQIKSFLSEMIPLLQTSVTGWRTDLLNSKIRITYNPEAEWTNTGLFHDPWNSSANLYKYADVSTINRTLTGGSWNTFCLPFDATEEQITAALGCSYELATHTSMNADGVTMEFSKLSDKSIKAGYPYLIKPASNVSNPTFSDVVVYRNADDTQGYNGDAVTFDNIHYFYGTLFTGTNIDTSTDYVFTDDVYDSYASMVNATSESIKGSRAFVRVNFGSVKFHIEGEEEETINDLTFDMANTDAATYENYIGENVNLTMQNRGNLYADGWCTICLPFTMTKKNFEAAIGMETKLREVDTATGSIINFKKLTDDAVTGKKVMYAGVPYLIMIDPEVGLQTTASTVNLDDVTFENVKIEATEGVSVDAGSGYAYVGTLKATTLATDGTNMFLGAADKLYKPYADVSKNSPLSGGKAYFVIPANTTNVKMVIDGKDEEFSAIKNVEVANADGQVYNLNGQVVKMKLNELPHGIYIVNGKKFVK